MAANSAVAQRAFSGGEISPALAARADLVKYQTGLRTCRNFIVQRHGGAANRPGTRMVGSCKTTNANVKIIPYVHENDGESVLIEAGNAYLRFYLNGAPVVIDEATVDAWDSGTDYIIGDLVKVGGVIYYAVATSTNHTPPNSTYWYALGAENIFEIPTPFTTTGLFHFHQSGRTITLTQLGVAPHELIYVSIDRWVFRAVTTSPIVQAPAGLALAPTTGALSFGYVVTAAAPGTYEESLPSGQVVDAAAAEPTDTAPHELTWTAQTVDGVACPEYYVYCDPYGNGAYGFIGTAGTNAFSNPGLTPDFSQSPPIDHEPFVDENSYPAISSTFQQRRAFARTKNDPDGVWLSRVGFPSNFGISAPLQDDDSISFKVAGANMHAVRALVAVKAGLALMTNGGEWTVTGAQGEPMKPNSIDPEQEAFLGISESVPPVVIGNGVVYVQARNSQIREIQFAGLYQPLVQRDLTVFASHLFDGHQIRSMALQLTPNPILWCVRDDGVLLGLTYVPDQDVWAWHRHDTQSGIFWDVCVVPEANEDVLYVITARGAVGATANLYVERLASRTILAANWDRDAFFVDAGLTYNDPDNPTRTVSGLDYLEGSVVAVVADGAVVFDGNSARPNAETFRVTDGAITIPATYKPAVLGFSIIHVGLAILHAELETCDLDIAGSQIRDKPKNVKAITAILEGSSRSFSAGQDADHLVPFAVATYDTREKSFNGQVELTIKSGFNDNGRVFIRQTDPLPITVLGLIPVFEVGG